MEAFILFYLSQYILQYNGCAENLFQLLDCDQTWFLTNYSLAIITYPHFQNVRVKGKIMLIYLSASRTWFIDVLSSYILIPFSFPFTVFQWNDSWRKPRDKARPDSAQWEQYCHCKYPLTLYHFFFLDLLKSIVLLLPIFLQVSKKRRKF